MNLFSVPQITLTVKTWHPAVYTRCEVALVRVANAVANALRDSWRDFIGTDCFYVSRTGSVSLNSSAVAESTRLAVLEIPFHTALPFLLA